MTRLRVAIAGAGGIGRHHAKWHAQAGSEVVAVLGRQPERLAATAQQLRDLFGFDGRTYTNMAELLRLEQPDVVDVCVLNEAHYSLTQEALAAGCHVLCEKPLVWAATPGEALTKARALQRQAETSGRLLGMCSQYAACLAQYGHVHPDTDPASSSTFEAEMETLSRGQPRDATAIWIDMGPHPLSLILAVWPQAVLQPGSLTVQFGQRSAEAEFTILSDTHQCRCRVVVRDCDAGPLTRRFAFDGSVVDLAGRADDTGAYRSVMTHGGVDHLGEDFMFLLIDQFTRVVAGSAVSPLVPAPVAVRNLELQATILEAA